MDHNRVMLNINEIKINWETNQCGEGEIPNSQKGKDLMMDLDLNFPPVFNLSLAVTPSYMNHQEAQAEVRRQFEPQTSKDFDVIDDEVVIISPRRFAEAKNNSRRNVEVRDTVGAETEVNNRRSDVSTSYPLNCNKRRRIKNKAVLNWELYVNSEDTCKIQTKNANLDPKTSESASGPASLSCPICMGTLKEETSTKCGHIFCKMCIDAAIKVLGIIVEEK
ncbi:hypothetical protein FNV43_RR01272 [Rhamnella rubrinervis]|uniref:RING-type domain-containing protein n=1 Tax=Rhamnella rubrinervis TaxID=2594499 RepID=A0A8K0HR56_9ROSA|nr:hypothetical protein FNV43_RR01272 [Rhamnella rubrinervis]